MGIKLDVELVMPTMPRSFVVRTLRPSTLDRAHDHLMVDVADLDLEAVEKICEQWAREFRDFAARQRRAEVAKVGSEGGFYFGNVSSKE